MSESKSSISNNSSISTSTSSGQKPTGPKKVYSNRRGRYNGRKYDGGKLLNELKDSYQQQNDLLQENKDLTKQVKLLQEKQQLVETIDRDIKFPTIRAKPLWRYTVVQFIILLSFIWNIIWVTYNGWEYFIYWLLSVLIMSYSYHYDHFLFLSFYQFIICILLWEDINSIFLLIFVVICINFRVKFNPVSWNIESNRLIFPVSEVRSVRFVPTVCRWKDVRIYRATRTILWTSDEYHISPEIVSEIASMIEQGTPKGSEYDKKLTSIIDRLAAYNIPLEERVELKYGCSLYANDYVSSFGMDFPEGEVHIVEYCMAILMQSLGLLMIPSINQAYQYYHPIPMQQN